MSTISAAQAARQNTRDGGGKYATMPRSETNGVDLTGDGAAETWIRIDRQYNRDGMIGPFPSLAAAENALNESLLIDGLCEEDCLDLYIADSVPGDDPELEQFIIDPADFDPDNPEEFERNFGFIPEVKSADVGDNVWIRVERDHGPDAMVGPYRSERDAGYALNNAMLIEGLAQEDSLDIYIADGPPVEGDDQYVIEYTDNPDEQSSYFGTDPNTFCVECNEEPSADYDMCSSCLHDAYRSGWSPSNG